MADIRHRVGIAAPAERVYEALASPAGVSGWWTDHVEGDGKAGGGLRMFFGSQEPSVEVKVAGLSPSERVHWQVVGSVAPEWVGTNILFDLKPCDGGTVLLFSHTDWREPVEFMHHCSTRWATFLLGLKSWLEGGASSRFPGEAPISLDWR